MAYTYFIDAYNLLYHSESLRSLLDVSFETARDSLIDKVARFCGVSGETVKLVFDGRGRSAESSLPPCGSPNLEIVFAPAHHSADAYIERAIYQSGHRKSIIVVSGDRGIRDLCMGMGALSMKPDHFLASIRDASKQVSDSALQTQTGKKLGAIESRLDNDALARLQALKDKLTPE